MKSICIEREDGQEVIYAVNDQNEGLFTRLPHENYYHQRAGTMQYHVKGYRLFLATLRRRGVTGRVVYRMGWD